jgi:hypothetical protein
MVPEKPLAESCGRIRPRGIWRRVPLCFDLGHQIPGDEARDIMRPLLGMAAELAAIRTARPLPESGNVECNDEHNEQPRPVWGFQDWIVFGGHQGY